MHLSFQHVLAGGVEPEKLGSLISILWKCVSYLIMTSSGVEGAPCPFMWCSPVSLPLPCHHKAHCRSNAYSMRHLPGCSFSAAQCFLKETHTWKWNFWNDSWMLSRGTLATRANTLLFFNMAMNISSLSF